MLKEVGFTLIELMISVVIIGILAAIAIPQYQNYVAKSQTTRIISEISEFKTTVEICLSEGEFNIGNGVNDCTPNTTGSNLINGSSQIGVNLPNNTGVAQFSNPLTATATVTAEISSNVAPPLQNKKIRWKRSDDGSWTCIASVKQQFLPVACTESNF